MKQLGAAKERQLPAEGSDFSAIPGHGIRDSQRTSPTFGQYKINERRSNRAINVCSTSGSFGRRRENPNVCGKKMVRFRASLVADTVDSSQTAIARRIKWGSAVMITGDNKRTAAEAIAKQVVSIVS